MTARRSAPNVSPLLWILAFGLAGCDGSTQPAPIPREAPPILAVTAPDVAPPGGTVLVRMHWLTQDCGASFLRFDTQLQEDGAWLLLPKWSWPNEGYACGAVLVTTSREQTIALPMPSAGSLRIRFNVAGRLVDRRVQPGVPEPNRGLLVEVVSVTTGLAIPGDTLTASSVTRDVGDSWSVGAPFLSNVTDSTGTLRIDLTGLDVEQRLMLRRKPPGNGLWIDFPFLETAPADQRAERASLYF